MFQKLKDASAKLGAVGSVGLATALVPMASHAQTDYTSLTAAVDWSAVGTALMAVGVAIIGVFVIFKGIKLVIKAVKGA